MKSLLLMTSFLLIFGTACNKPTSNSDSGGGNTMTVQKTAIYPHTDEFKTTKVHGQTHFQDRTVCAKCHGIDYAGGQAKVSCNKCHQYPHEAGFAVPQNHGAIYANLAPEKRSDCLKCHTNTAEAPARVACVTCHAAFPHDENIMADHVTVDPTTNLRPPENTANKCVACHTDTSNVSCASCHDAAEWGRFEAHWKKPPAKNAANGKKSRKPAARKPNTSHKKTTSGSSR